MYPNEKKRVLTRRACAEVRGVDSLSQPKMPPTLPIDQLMNLIRLDGDLRTRLLPAQWAALDQLHQLYQVRPPPGVLLTGAAPSAALLTRAAAVLCLFCAGEPC